MPRQLLSYSKWEVLKIDVKAVQPGDLIFVRNVEHEKLLSHIALVIEVDKIFHCSPRVGTAVIQPPDQFFLSYEQKLNFKQMIRYIDPRNKKLREKQKGTFILE